MKSALELAMEKMRRLDKEMTPEEKEAGRRRHYIEQGNTLAHNHLKNRSSTLEKVEAEVQQLPEGCRELTWQGFWQAILAALQFEAASERAEAAVVCLGGEEGEALIERLHHLCTVLQQREADVFASCVAHFECHERLQRLAAAGIQVDYSSVARQSRYWREQQADLLASQTAALEKEKASLWGTLFDNDYSSMG